MPSKFVDEKELQRIEIGEEEYVEVPKRLPYGLLAEIADIKVGEAERNAIFLTKIIKAWNLKDGSGNVPQITIENVKRLDAGVIATISSAVAPMFEISKKAQPN